MPRDLDAFVGRQEEIAAITAHLHEGANLITLTGIGGVGKTRLATRIATQLQAEYAQGARVVMLAPLPEGANVAAAVLAKLGLREQPHATSADTLADVLRDVHLLLVLDNCEHVVQPSAELVDDMLRRCPGLHILATSRERLGVPGERVFRVPPLAPPAPDEPFEALVHSDAVELFVERARTAEPDFRLTPARGAAIARICRLLDGIPLAIELAAARTKSMNVLEISNLLSDPLELLTAAPRTAPARQQTLRATIDWSYALLTAQEQTLLRRLAVFNGGSTQEAVKAVCAGPDLPAERVLDLLDRLISKSLVIALEDNKTTRYTLLETMRRYLMACLATAHEEDTLRVRHRDWCIDVAERTKSGLVDPVQLALLAREQDNLQAALHWALESDQAAAACRLAVGMSPLWLLQGRFAEGRTQLAAACELPSSVDCPLQVSWAYSWAATLLFNEGAYVAAEDHALRGLALAEAAGDRQAVAAAQFQVGKAAFGQGDLARAAERFESGLNYDDDRGPQAVLNAFCLGEVMFETGNQRRAEELLTLAVNWARAARYNFADGRMLAQRAVFAEIAGDHALADQLLAEAVAAERAVGLPGLIEVLTTSGTIFADRGEHAHAADTLREALASAAAHGSLDRLARVLEAISGLVAARQPGTCVRLAAAADQLRDSLRALPRPSERRRLGVILQAARRRLGEAAYARTWSAARSTSLDAILDEGRDVLQNLGVAVVAVPGAAGAGMLSEREREVVLLVMRGLSNRAIADELVVTRKTAEAHIGHILTKLGLTNRVQIATWAYEHGLAQSASVVPGLVSDATG